MNVALRRVDLNMNICHPTRVYKMMHLHGTAITTSTTSHPSLNRDVKPGDLFMILYI
jgi:hypothetical protein